MQPLSSECGVCVVLIAVMLYAETEMTAIVTTAIEVRSRLSDCND